MRNQYMAKVLVHNKVVSEDQVKAHWGEISDSMDIGQVLVRAGRRSQAQDHRTSFCWRACLRFLQQQH